MALSGSAPPPKIVLHVFPTQSADVHPYRQNITVRPLNHCSGSPWRPRISRAVSQHGVVLVRRRLYQTRETLSLDTHLRSCVAVGGLKLTSNRSFLDCPVCLCPDIFPPPDENSIIELPHSGWLKWLDTSECTICRDSLFPFTICLLLLFFSHFPSCQVSSSDWSQLSVSSSSSSPLQSPTHSMHL